MYVGRVRRYIARALRACKLLHLENGDRLDLCICLSLSNLASGNVARGSKSRVPAITPRTRAENKRMSLRSRHTGTSVRSSLI